MTRVLTLALIALALIAPVVAEAQSQGTSNHEIQRFPLPGGNTTGWRIHDDGTRLHLTLPVGALKFSGTTHANLGNYDLGPGTLIYCTDCTKASPCASGGTGAWAKKRDGKTVGFDCD